MFSCNDSYATNSSTRRTRRTVLAGLALIGAFGLAACGGTDGSVPDGDFTPPVVEFQVVFEDEFDGTDLDLSKWNIDEGDGCPDLCGWGNNEAQVYTADNITVAGGVLTIEARQEADGTFTSGRINTKGKFDFRYGRVEVRARLPEGQGTWPAIWLLHSDPEVYGPWPLSGEIDIMEAFNLGVNGNTATQSTLHYGLPTPPFGGTSSVFDNDVSPATAFRTYALEWERDRVRFFVDGEHFQSQNSENWYAYFPADDEEGFYDPFGAFKQGPIDAPFDQLFHLIINFALGGNPVGEVDENALPQVLEIDSVRVYECVNANPDTGRGCGTGNPDVVPLEDNDGNPLEDVETAQPFVEELDLYEDGPASISLQALGETYTNNLSTVIGFQDDTASVINDPAFVDPEDPENTVWRVGVSGGIANVLLTGEEFTDNPLLETGFDFSGFRGSGGPGTEPVGEIAFEMEIVSMTPGTELVIRLDSGFPNTGDVVLPVNVLAPAGERKPYSVKFSDFLANPGFVDCCGGTGVDLANVVNPFVLEVRGGDAEVLIDNIRATNACKVVGGCGVDLKNKGFPDLIVYDDAVNTSQWGRGIVASDSGSGFTDYTDGTNPANKVNWAEVPADDPERGQVIEVTFNDSSEFGVWFIGSQAGVDVTPYAAGAVQFDIRVLDYGNAPGITFKVDCFFPCTSGDKNLGVVGDGEWETVTFPVSQLTSSGLDLEAVNTGVVIFPSSPQTGGITFQVDNIRWIAETEAPPPAQIDLPVTFDEEGVDYSLADFGGAGTTLVADPTNANNTVASTTKSDGAETFAGTVVGNGSGFANPIPFEDGETTMSVRVYSPAAGIPVLFKVENADASVFAEVITNTTVANEWETLTFDFSTVGIDLTATYVQAIIFFDFGQTGDGSTYLWDDVAFGAGGPPPGAGQQQVVFDDTVDPTWDTGIAGTESPNFPLIQDGTAGSVVNWAVVPAADPVRGDVIEATIGGAAPEFGLLFIQSSGPTDLTAFADGSVVFDILVTDYGTNTNGMIMKIDCGFPCTSGDTPIGVVGDGVWETVSVPVSQLVGTGLNLATVNTGLVVFPDVADQQAGATVTFQIDNVRWEPEVLTAQPVFDDAVAGVFDVGIAGTESPNFPLIEDGTAGTVVNWEVVPAAEAARGNVIEATIGGAAPEFGLLFIQSSTGLDLSAYDEGAVVFDINVLDYDTNTNGMIMKIDCVFPCTSGDLPIGVVGDGGWETVSIEIAQLVSTGLDLSTVNTGLVVFPDVADQQAGATVIFQIDNVRWEP